MLYPEFIKKGETIGICAPSAGVGRKLEDFNKSINTLERLFQTKETRSVRLNNMRGGDAETRGKELTSLFTDQDVKMVMSAAGGDFLFEVLPHIDWNTLLANPKWMMGASDPTSILFTYTTKYDIATLYGCNAGSYDEVPLPDYACTNLEIIQGNLIPQQTSNKHAPIASFLPDYKGRDTTTIWYSNKSSIKTTGRCIGGCIDVLKDLIGTKYDAVESFNEKYKEDGLVWYFDNFGMSAENFYRTLLQMKYAGWFQNTKAILIGRHLLKSSDTGMTYEEAVALALSEYPVIYDMDIGHTSPCFTMINGAMITVDYFNGKGIIKFELK